MSTTITTTASQPTALQTGTNDIGAQYVQQNLDLPIQSSSFGPERNHPDLSRTPTQETSSISLPSENSAQRFICEESGCPHPLFPTKGGLVRHVKEVHASKLHFCPISTCQRHARGFGRAYNLLDHQKRCHPQFGGMSAAIKSKSSGHQPNKRHRSHSQEDVDKAPSSAAQTTTFGSDALQDELQRLYELREEINRDIETIERASHILETSHE
jgi:hypothetical protein